VQEGCGYKDALRAHRYHAPLAKYFTVCITFQPILVSTAVVFSFSLQGIHQAIHPVFVLFKKN